MTWKRTLGLEKEPLGAYLDDPTPQNAVSVAQEYSADDVTRFAETLGTLPTLIDSYHGSTMDVLDLEQEIDAYNREMSDIALGHRSQQLRRAWNGAGDVAANTWYGAGNLFSNTVLGTVDAVGDVGVHAVDAVYDVRDARNNRREPQAS